MASDFLRASIDSRLLKKVPRSKRRRFDTHLFQQITHIELVGPILEIICVEPILLLLQHTGNVAPLPVGCLAPFAIPDKLMQNHIFGRGDPDEK